LLPGYLRCRAVLSAIVVLLFCAKAFAQDTAPRSYTSEPSEPDATAAAGLVSDARTALEKNEPARALDILCLVARLDYFNKDLYYLMARAFDTLGQRENAYMAWEFAKGTAPQRIREYFPPSAPRSPLHEVDSSNENLASLLRKHRENPKSIEIVRDLLIVYETRQDADSALKYLGIALELEPENLDHFLHKCEILNMKKREAEGAAFCLEILKKLPDKPVILRELAAFLMDLKRYVEAMKYLERANKIEPNNAATIRGLGLAQLGLREYDKALELLRKAVKLDESDLRSWGSMGFVYLTAKKDYEKAFDCYYRVYKAEPAFSDGDHIENRIMRCLQGLADSILEPHLKAKDLLELEKLLQHPNPFVRYKASFSLGRLKAAGSLPALRRLLVDPLEDIRSVAQFALATIGGEEVGRILEEGLVDKDPFVRAWSVYGYTMLNRDTAIGRVLEFAESKFPFERLAAYKSLAIMTTEQARTELGRRLATEENERVRQLMRKLLEQKK
jgi:tetratricopeptide (TPR) repeat protein